MEDKDKLLEQINQKIQEAPDSSYKVGIFIGQMLPYIVLVVFAYLLYWYMKNKSNGNDKHEIEL